MFVLSWLGVAPSFILGFMTTYLHPESYAEPDQRLLAYRSALARAVADHIRRFPDTYDQGEWGLDWDRFDSATPQAVIECCDTPACVAGWAARLAVPSHLELAWEEVASEAGVEEVDRSEIHVSTVARHLLGLTEAMAEGGQGDEVSSSMAPLGLFHSATSESQVLGFLDALGAQA